MEPRTETWTGPHNSNVTATETEDGEWEVEGTMYTPFKSVHMEMPDRFPTAEAAIGACRIAMEIVLL